jgi:hypothetical protein
LPALVEGVEVRRRALRKRLHLAFAEPLPTRPLEGLDRSVKRVPRVVPKWAGP